MRAQEQTLFSRCLGLDDRDALAKQRIAPDEAPGITELIACSNLTVRTDGSVESVPGLSTVLTHGAAVTGLSARQRFFFTDDISTHEWDATTVTTPFPLVSGAMAQTPIDCRVATASTVYKSRNAAKTMLAATVGDNPDPPTSRVLSAMPVYAEAFVHHDRLYAVNAADPRFLQYSEGYHYDLWALGDSHIGHATAIVDAGAIPGCIALTHADHVSLYVGSGPADFRKLTYACLPLANTLFSGKVSETEYAHLFLAADGVYRVASSGEISRVSGERLTKAGTLNTSYACATVDNGKYLAFGNSLCVEYDTHQKAVMLRSSQSVVAAAHWNGAGYYAAGSTISRQAGFSTQATSLTLPYNTFGEHGSKSISDLHFTGTVAGNLTLTATGTEGRSWSLTLPPLGTAFNRRIKTPRGYLGNHVKLTLATDTGAFRMEQLRATFAASRRSR